MMNSRIPKRTSGHLDRYFFFRCPEVGLGFVFFAIVRTMKSRIPNPTSGHLDRLSFFEVSGGRIRIFEVGCTDVVRFHFEVSRS